MGARPLLLLAAVLGCPACLASGGSEPIGPVDAGLVPRDASVRDAGRDAGRADASTRDGGRPDAMVGRDGGPDGGVPSYTWWRDVRPIVETRCNPCHQDPPRRGAPYALVTYAQVTALDLAGERIYARMAAEVMARREPPAGEIPLTSLQIDTIVGWAALGAPEGTPPDAGLVDSGALPEDAGAPLEDAGAPEDGGGSLEDAAEALDVAASPDAGVEPDAE